MFCCCTMLYVFVNILDFAGEISQDYNGPREVNGIVKYMKAQVGPSSKECSSDADVEKLRQKDEVVVVGYYSDDEEMKEFQKAADAMRESVAFGHCKGCGKKVWKVGNGSEINVTTQLDPDSRLQG